MRTLINRKTLGKKIFFLVNVCGNGRVCLMEPAWSQSETSLQMVAADAAASSTAGALSRMDEWEGWVTAWITYMHGLICCCGYRWLDVENSPEINLKTRWRRNFIYSWFVCLLPAGQTQVSSAVNTLCEELTRWRQADIPPLSEPASPMGGGWLWLKPEFLHVSMRQTKEMHLPAAVQKTAAFPPRAPPPPLYWFLRQPPRVRRGDRREEKALWESWKVNKGTQGKSK